MNKLSLALLVIGALAFVCGVYLIYPPFAVIVASVLIVAGGVMNLDRDAS